MQPVRDALLQKCETLTDHRLSVYVFLIMILLVG